MVASSFALPQHAFAVSESNPFVPLADIADMSLADLAVAFRYALESTKDGFDPKRFFSGMLPKMKQILGRMSYAVSRSRGHGIPAARTDEVSDSPVQSGNIDALYFCAAMRIFAEWRVLRQVPDGYKGYAVGMNLGQKDGK